jgi:DNA-binding transcriptional ArsR family regulator
MIDATKKMLDYTGISRERLYLDWVSAAEGVRFAKVVTDFTEKIKNLGQLHPINSDEILRLKAIKMATHSERLRWVIGKQSEFQKEGNKYKEVFTQHEIERMVEGVIIEELIDNEIILKLNGNSMSVKQIAKDLNYKNEVVLSHIFALKRKGMVKLEKVEGNSPYYSLNKEIVKGL